LSGVDDLAWAVRFGIGVEFAEAGEEAAFVAQFGGTVVIGGIFTQDEQIATNKVPLLGDIPILGYLFQNLYNRSAIEAVPQIIDNKYGKVTGPNQMVEVELPK